MSLEVKPGMFSLAEAKVSWKAPSLMAVFSVLVFVAFGILGRREPVEYTVTADDAAISLPSVTALSSTVGIVLGIVMMLISALAFFRVISKRPVPLWWSMVFGFIAVVALLGWLAAGDRVPFAFLLANAIVLAIPIIFGGMAGVMSERVGVVNI
ncbi:MAG: ABC transporter permease, partial [Microbacteriaceae bacterium]|nr:ABC transporter permease [Microbacteriaceae bacterium]